MVMASIPSVHMDNSNPKDKALVCLGMRRDGLASAYHVIGRGLAPQSGHTKTIVKMVQTASPHVLG